MTCQLVRTCSIFVAFSRFISDEPDHKVLFEYLRCYCVRTSSPSQHSNEKSDSFNFAKILFHRSQFPNTNGILILISHHPYLLSSKTSSKVMRRWGFSVLMFLDIFPDPLSTLSSLASSLASALTSSLASPLTSALTSPPGLGLDFSRYYPGTGTGSNILRKNMRSWIEKETLSNILSNNDLKKTKIIYQIDNFLVIF